MLWEGLEPLEAREGPQNSSKEKSLKIHTIELFCSERDCMAKRIPKKIRQYQEIEYHCKSNKIKYELHLLPLISDGLITKAAKETLHKLGVRGKQWNELKWKIERLLN